MSVSLGEFANAQQDWSYKTFGPPEARGPKGALNHLAKEAKEAADEVDSGDKEKLLLELADCLFLVVDATHRAGFWVTDLLSASMKKLDINKERVWRDWRELKDGEPSEHIKS